MQDIPDLLKDMFKDDNKNVFDPINKIIYLWTCSEEIVQRHKNTLPEGFALLVASKEFVDNVEQRIQSHQSIDPKDMQNGNEVMIIGDNSLSVSPDCSCE